MMSDYKQSRIKPLIGDNQHVTYLPINLKSEPLQQNLTDAGCDNTLATMFIREGQSQCLAKQQVEAILQTIATFAKGS